MKKKALILSACFLILLLAGTAWGASDIANLTINAQVDAVAILTLGETIINFPATTPPTQFVATENPVSVRCQVLIDLTEATLTVICDGPLTSATSTIAIANVTWTATGAGYNAAGTMSSGSAQAAGSWAISGDYVGAFSFFLANSWLYHTGSYTAIATYTLTAP
jgi:hypothetical protein